MPYQLAIFDFDGTLADSFPWFSRMLNAMAQRHGFKQVAEHEAETLRTYDARRILQHLEIPAWKVPLIAHDMRKSMAANIDQIRLFAGIDDMLERAHGQGVRLAIASSNSEPNIRRVLGRQQAERIVHYACGTSLFGKASTLEKLLRRLDVAPTRAIYVGDELRDLHAARKAKLAFGAVSWGYTNAATLAAAGPDVLFKTPADLLAHLA